MGLQGLGRILVLNAGSSSLKFKLFDLAPALASSVGGMIDRIGDKANSALIAKATLPDGTKKWKDQVGCLTGGSTTGVACQPCICLSVLHNARDASAASIYSSCLYETRATPAFTCMQGVLYRMQPQSTAGKQGSCSMSPAPLSNRGGGRPSAAVMTDNR